MGENMPPLTIDLEQAGIAIGGSVDSSFSRRMGPHQGTLRSMPAFRSRTVFVRMILRMV